MNKREMDGNGTSGNRLRTLVTLNKDRQAGERASGQAAKQRKGAKRKIEKHQKHKTVLNHQK